eukprot:6173636-Pleurochrysis_carterae.AAC.4
MFRAVPSWRHLQLLTPKTYRRGGVPAKSFFSGNHDHVRGSIGPFRSTRLNRLPARSFRSTPAKEVGPLIAGVGIALVAYGAKMLIQVRMLFMQILRPN